MRQESEVLATSERRPLLLLARIILALTLLGIAAGIVVAVLDARRTNAAVWGATDFAFTFAFAAFPVAGYVLASRRPGNAIGWLLLGIGATLGVSGFTDSYASYAVHGGPGGTEVGALLEAIGEPMWVPIVALPATFLILLFPDGHLPSPSWRWFARILGAALVIVFAGILLTPGKLVESRFPDLHNPIGVEWLRPLTPFAGALLGLLPIGVVASLTSLVQRFRRATGVERLQLRWLVTAAGAIALLYSVALAFSFGGGWGETGVTPGWMQALQTAAILSFALIPIAIGVSVLRYRLFEIDVVINRAVLFGALAIFITAVYIAMVVGVGALAGSRADPVLSAAAAAVVAIAFQPARRRAQRLADRLVYGKRASPYEVLSEFSKRLGTAYANEELLPKMARTLADGTGAARADVWIRIGDELRPEATWPRDSEPAVPIPAAANAEGSSSPPSMLEAVRHDGELLGALSIRKKPGESITPTEERLVRDLAGQAGLVMRNVALTEQLMDNIEQLRASRQRLVTAQDEERRKLERNLHDGAQQQIVALAIKLRLLEQLIDRDAGKAKSIAAELQTGVRDALEELRDLARGIYPPLLADQGLVAALDSQARKSVVPVTIEAAGIGRYPREAEAAVYFSCLEALQNVAKYAHASRATVRLWDGDGRLRFAVTDDGVGFETDESSYGSGLQGISDRLSAMGGEVHVRSSPGAGTSVSGDLPIA